MLDFFEVFCFSVEIEVWLKLENVKIFMDFFDVEYKVKMLII